VVGCDCVAWLEMAPAVGWPAAVGEDDGTAACAVKIVAKNRLARKIALIRFVSTVNPDNTIHGQSNRGRPRQKRMPYRKKTTSNF